MSRTVAAIVTELARVEDQVRWASLGAGTRTDALRLAELTAREDALVRELRAVDVSIDLSASPTPAPAPAL
ncbi:hypothetical protein [Intrasporangium sp. YIM S08009]|uniref:hypothetical protein n=1 Tax=Intrasporangium zincisolvens TaxID=3080018 RepID=UPI002B05D83F|nr:hypothetical protein [Intrasporangium sp. YIM S08009]